jgi:hypothetical protein
MPVKISDKYPCPKITEELYVASQPDEDFPAVADMAMYHWLGKEPGRICNFIVILEVHTVSSLARVRRIANGAVLPIHVICERPLKVQSMINVGKAEFDVIALRIQSADFNDKTITHLHPQRSCPA